MFQLVTARAEVSVAVAIIFLFTASFKKTLIELEIVLLKQPISLNYKQCMWQCSRSKALKKTNKNLQIPGALPPNFQSETNKNTFLQTLYVIKQSHQKTDTRINTTYDSHDTNARHKIPAINNTPTMHRIQTIPMIQTIYIIQMIQMPPHGGCNCVTLHQVSTFTV